MKASEIQQGDEFRTIDGGVLYTVREVVALGSRIRAEVEYIDGGNEQRTWNRTALVPLVRPSK